VNVYQNDGTLNTGVGYIHEKIFQSNGTCSGTSIPEGGTNYSISESDPFNAMMKIYGVNGDTN